MDDTATHGGASGTPRVAGTVPAIARAARPTLVAVARAAGVAPSTASLAFSGNGPVSEETRARVLAAAAKLGYDGPDPRARSLRRGRSGQRQAQHAAGEKIETHHVVVVAPFARSTGNGGHASPAYRIAASRLQRFAIWRSGA